MEILEFIQLDGEATKGNFKKAMNRVFKELDKKIKIGEKKRIKLDLFVL